MTREENELSQSMHKLPDRLQPETGAYHIALYRWRAFRSDAVAAGLKEMLRERAAFGTPAYVRALDLLPPPERRPVVFGELVFFVREWDREEFKRIREEILPDASTVEVETLDAVGKGTLVVPGPVRLPVTTEEFPSRIWCRALASESPARLVSAGMLSINAMNALLQEADFLPVDDGEREFQLAIGDPAPAFDVLALAAPMHRELRMRLLDGLVESVNMNRFSIFDGHMRVIPAWVLLDRQDSAERVQRFVGDARDCVDEFTGSDRRTLVQRHHLRQLGRILCQLGQRGEARRCAKAIGVSALAEGWQLQPTGGKLHGRIRKRLLRGNANGESWQFNPTFACSAMSLPLWLADGVCRMPVLTELFRRAESCPWVFPRLCHVFQWHLAIAGNQSALEEVKAMASDCALGLV